MFITDKMCEYATIKTAPRGHWLEISVTLSRPGGNKLVANELMRKNAGRAFPLFIEVDRRLVNG